MAANDLDAKDQREIDADAGIGPSADELETHNPDLDDYDDLDGLDDDDSSAETLKTDKGQEEPQDKGQEPGEGKAEEEPPFHEHPRWQEMLAKQRELEERLAERERQWEEERRLYLSRLEGKEEPDEPRAPFDDVLKMDPDQILDALQEDPQGFIKGLVDRSKYEAVQELEQKSRMEAQEAAIRRGLETFAKAHEDFMPLVASGEIEGFIAENPHHNAISAYYAITESKRSENTAKEMEQRIKEAEKKAREAALKEIQAKGSATVLDGSSSSGVPPQEGGLPPDLAEPEKHGGLRSVIARHLAQYRERRG